MEIVYLDELFALNLVVDYFLLLATAKICALPFTRVRFALAAALGAGWSCFALVPSLAFLGTAPMRGVLALAMSLAAFGAERRLLRCFFAFLGVSALFGGAVYAAGLHRGIAQTGGALTRVDMRVLALSFAACWALVSLVFRRSAENARRVVREMTVERGGASVSLRALEDTGNGLYDPVTGRAAFVAEADAVAALFPADAAAWLRAPPVDAIGHIPGARLIPCAGVCGEGLLLAFRPDRVTVDGVTRRDLLAAVCPRPLGGDGSYEAIL